jgi:acyl dehydratase
MSGLDLVAGTWDDARALVGQQLASFTAADPVERGAIRRLLEVHEWDWPPGQEVAPASTYLTFALPAYWSPGDPSIGRYVIPPLPFRTVPGEGSMMVASDVDVAFGAPIRVGDRLRATYWLRGVTEKATVVGSGAFLDFEARFTNQRDELVAAELVRTLRYTPVDPPAARVPPAPSSDPVPPGASPVLPVAVDLTLQRLVMAAGANRDFAPVHHDPAVAREAGMGVPFANSMFIGTHLERTAAEWAGWERRVEHLSFRLVAPAVAGATLTCAGWSDGMTCHLEVCTGSTALVSIGRVRLGARP